MLKGRKCSRLQSLSHQEYRLWSLVSTTVPPSSPELRAQETDCGLLKMTTTPLLWLLPQRVALCGQLYYKRLASSLTGNVRPRVFVRMKSTVCHRPFHQFTYCCDTHCCVAFDFGRDKGPAQLDLTLYALSGVRCRFSTVTFIGSSCPRTMILLFPSQL